MKILVFYSDNKFCDKVIKDLKDNNINFEAIQADGPDNIELIEKYKIRIAPTIIKENDNGVEISRVIGNLNPETLKSWSN